MGDNVQNKQCSRCSSKTLTNNDFGIDKYGNYFKTCNNCRDSSNQRKANNKEAIKQQSRLHYLDNREAKIASVKQWKANNEEKLLQTITCPCGGKYQHRWKADHEKTQRHKKHIVSIS